MITKENILQLLQEYDADNKYFVVDCTIGSSNKISLLIDTSEGINIKECVQISRYIEHQLDRDQEDFELNVSSPGLDAPLRVAQQYEKNIGRELKVVTETKTYKGTLTAYNDDQIKLEYEERVKEEGRKRKIKLQRTEIININEIKTARVVISFK